MKRQETYRAQSRLSHRKLCTYRDIAWIFWVDQDLGYGYSQVEAGLLWFLYVFLTVVGRIHCRCFGVRRFAPGLRSR